MSTRHTLTLGAERFRVGPWHSDADVAYLGLAPDVPRPSVNGVHRCLGRLREEGYSSIVTSALHPDEAASFLRAGFVEHDRLRVLAHDLSDLDPPRPSGAAVRLARPSRAERAEALALDGRAFEPFWRLDETGLDEAIRATPRRRFRVGRVGGEVAGYAVTGRSGRQAFLQRLATDPRHAGRGVASALVVDALRWAARHRAARVLVNTQSANGRALDLYLRLGFELTPTDLLVLTRPIT